MTRSYPPGSPPGGPSGSSGAPSDGELRETGAAIARAAHDIRAPVHTVVALTELLQQTSLDDTQRSYVTSLRSATALLLRLVDDLLFKSTGSPISLRHETFSPRGVVEQVADLVAIAARAKGLTLTSVVGAGVARLLVGDAPRVTQALANFASNAVKYTEHGAVVIRAARVGQDRYRFSVTDTGPGIAPSEHERIFQALTQLDPGGPAGGVGLGLAIAREVVATLGGRVGLTSDVGQGSEFWLEVELSEATDTHAAVAVGDLRFALIDCSPATVEALESALAEWAPTIDVLGIDVLGIDVPLDPPPHVVMVGSMDAVHDLLGPEGASKRAGFAARGLPVVALVPPDELARLPSDVAGVALPLRAHELLAALSFVLRARTSTLVGAGSTPNLELSGVRVLVVDDVASNLRYVQLCLEAAGATVVTTSSAIEAGEWLAEDGQAESPSRFSIALLDLEMPGSNTIAVIEAVRRHERARSAGSVPIVALSAHTDEKIIDAVFAAGVTAYLAKPATREDLVVAVATYARRPSASAGSPPVSGLSAEARSRVKEAQMALVRRDFRAVGLALDGLEAEVAVAPARAALAIHDVSALQGAFNAFGAEPVPGPQIEQATRPRAPHVSTSLLTTRIRAEFATVVRFALAELDVVGAQLERDAEMQARVRSTAHRLAGTSSMFGFPALGEVASAFARALAKHGERADLEALAEARREMRAALVAVVDGR